jgi:hypothetical protein
MYLGQRTGHQDANDEETLVAMSAPHRFSAGNNWPLTSDQFAELSMSYIYSSLLYCRYNCFSDAMTSYYPTFAAMTHL